MSSGFDLVMFGFRVRPPSPAECDLARHLFGDSLDLAHLKIVRNPAWNRAFVAGPNLIIWPSGQFQPCFATAPLALRALLVHELVHVWQAQKGINLILGKLRAGDGPEAYLYRLEEDVRFEALNIEQQAMVVEHAYRLSQGGAAPYGIADYARLAGPATPRLG